jgi:hypothetical protein
MIVPVSGYGLGIVVICAVAGFVLSGVIASVVTGSTWRLVIFCVGVAAAVVCVGIEPRAYDDSDALAAIFYSSGALLGWVVGFGISIFVRRDSA